MTMTEDRTVLTDEQRAWIEGLRELADFAEAHPEVVGAYPMPSSTFHGVLRSDPDDTRDELRTRARSMAPCEKQFPDHSPDTLHLVKRFGPHKITVYADREAVCERRVVDTEDVEVEVYSDEAQAVIDSLPKVTRTETREIVEWDCGSILAPTQETVTARDGTTAPGGSVHE